MLIIRSQLDAYSTHTIPVILLNEHVCSTCKKNVNDVLLQLDPATHLALLTNIIRAYTVNYFEHDYVICSQP